MFCIFMYNIFSKQEQLKICPTDIDSFRFILYNVSMI